MDGSQHVSFDQYVADQVAVPGRFCYLGFTPNAGDVDNAGFYDTAGNPVTLARTDNTYGFLGNQFARVFDGLSSGMTTAMPAKPTGMDLSRARRQVSVEFVRGQYAKAMAKLGADDRMKLSLHRDMLEDLALRVQSVSQIMCTKPTYPAKGSQTDIEIANILMTQLLPVAMACDLTRVGQVGYTQLRAVDLGAEHARRAPGHRAPGGRHQQPGRDVDGELSQDPRAAVRRHDLGVQGRARGVGHDARQHDPHLMNELANGGHDLFRMMYVMAGGKNLAAPGPLSQVRRRRALEPVQPPQDVALRQHAGRQLLLDKFAWARAQPTARLDHAGVR